MLCKIYIRHDIKSNDANNESQITFDEFYCTNFIFVSRKENISTSLVVLILNFQEDTGKNDDTSTRIRVTYTSPYSIFVL